MLKIFKAFFPRKIVGIDIGTASIKIVEISCWGNSKRLTNYGEVKLPSYKKENLSDANLSNNVISNDVASSTIKAILVEAGIKAKSAIFSVPDFYTFCTSFDIPPMPAREITGAVLYNASRYITSPISEVSLDYKIISEFPSGSNYPIKIFIVAIPKRIIEDYKLIAKNAGLELVAVESEVYGITKAFIKDNLPAKVGISTICIVDIGAQSSTINIIDKGFLKKSYSSNFNSSKFTDNVTPLLSSLDPFLVEIKNIVNDFSQSDQKTIEEFYLSGGAANIPGLKEYFAKNIGRQVSLPNCFSTVLYPSLIKETIHEMSPRFSAALGVALDGLEI